MDAQNHGEVIETAAAIPGVLLFFCTWFYPAHSQSYALMLLSLSIIPGYYFCVRHRKPGPVYENDLNSFSG